ncbi:alpha/beta fold hydrolase [Micromonospora sp. NPDC047670]|uniref:alpha/beta fold hydrolase n=1 Tax=Micromonospora sp. NPDC047670 TaxID=3364252 RepID=UPI00371C223A
MSGGSTRGRRKDPEGGAPFARPTLVLTRRQDHATGYLDQFALLPHFPRATFAVLDVAGHNLQIEQPGLFDALVGEWLDRVAGALTAAVSRPAPRRTRPRAGRAVRR